MAEIKKINGIYIKDEFARNSISNLQNNMLQKQEGKSLVDDAEIARLATLQNYDDTSVRNLIQNKSDKDHTHDYNELDNLPVIPSVEGLASEEFVRNAIAEAQLDSDEVDLSGLATKTELAGKADKDHVHDNFVVKEVGKSLISDSEINRLATLKNYDDTELRALIAANGGNIGDAELPSIEGLATEAYVMRQLGGKRIEYIAYADYKLLTEEEKNDDSVVYNIIDFDDVFVSENDFNAALARIVTLENSLSSAFSKIYILESDGNDLRTNLSTLQTTVTNMQEVLDGLTGDSQTESE